MLAKQLAECEEKCGRILAEKEGEAGKARQAKERAEAVKADCEERVQRYEKEMVALSKKCE